MNYCDVRFGMEVYRLLILSEFSAPFSMHDFLVNFGLGPQLCIYDLLVNLLALLPDPRVDAGFASSIRSDNGTLIATGEKTAGSEAMVSSIVLLKSVMGIKTLNNTKAGL